MPWIEKVVIELRVVDGPLRPAEPDQQVATLPFIAIGQYRIFPLRVAPDERPTIGADRTHWFVGGVVGHLGKVLVTDRSFRVADERFDRDALEPHGSFDSREVAQRRVEIDVRDELVDDLTAAPGFGSANDQHDAGACSVEVAFHAGEWRTMIGGADDHGRFGQSKTIDGVQKRSDRAVEILDPCLKARCVVAGLGGIG